MEAPQRLPAGDAIRTYRYLRLGIIGAVVLLAASIAIERSHVDCFQTSISAYYYTPVRAIFVGTMMAVGFALIVYRGRDTWEDLGLNFAGMLAPVVAVAPTTDVGRCWSVVPEQRPVRDGELAGWVVANVDNNMGALLIAGALGVLTAVIVTAAIRLSGRDRSPLDPGTWISLGVTAVALVVVWWLLGNWDAFYTRAHGFAAVGMFLCLIAVVLFKGLQHHRDENARWFVTYTVIGLLMLGGGLVIWLTRVFGEHTVFALEAYEITLFATYWIVQTVENWEERLTLAPT